VDEREISGGVEKMTTTTKRGWLEEGLALLAEAGASVLTIDLLTSRLGVTKGSFYHHFRNWQDYKECLLALYEDQRTLQIIESAQQQLTPTDRLELVIQATLRGSNQLEVALRAWALQDPFVQAYQQRIDQRRLAYLEELAWQLCQDHERARCVARLFYSVFVGSQHILPPIQGQDLEALYREVEKLSNLPPSASGDQDPGKVL
jgi:AcrR family transcriptional regulator